MTAAVSLVAGALAQIVPAPSGWTIEALLEKGIAIGMLGWFMFRAEKRLSGLERAINRMVRVQAMDVASRPGTSARARQAYRDVLREVGSDVDVDADLGVSASGSGS